MCVLVVVQLVVDAGTDGFGRGVVAIHGALESDFVRCIYIYDFVNEFVESATEKDCALDEY